MARPTRASRTSAGNALVANDSWSFTTAAAGGPCAANAITAENCLTGNPSSEWDVSGAGDPSIQGYATQISVNRGGTVQFKVDTNATNYRFDIYRMGYYGGMGARKITTVNPSASLPQNQPNCLTQASTGLIDCGNWAVSGSWTVPATATSGIYFAKVVRTDTGGASHIVFIVRNDASTSDLVFQTSDTTWQAYNNYGGNSLYVGSPGTNPGRAYKVSYNRPFTTRGDRRRPGLGVQRRIPDGPLARGQRLRRELHHRRRHRSRARACCSSHRAFLSVGHDEYWSGAAARQRGSRAQRRRQPGVLQRQRSVLEDALGKQHRRLGHRLSHAGLATRRRMPREDRSVRRVDRHVARSALQPAGRWRSSGECPDRHDLHGELGHRGHRHPGRRRQDAPVARHAASRRCTGAQTATLPNGTLGYEWDSDLDNGSRPAGLIRLSDTTVSGVDKLQDYGSTYASGHREPRADDVQARERRARLRRGHGPVVAGVSMRITIAPVRRSSQRMQQATVNLFADMNVQPANLQAGTAPRRARRATSPRRPSVITTPAAGANVPQNAVTISGTASDVGGHGRGRRSVDRRRYDLASGHRSRHLVVRLGDADHRVPSTVRVRAVDDSGNLQSTPTTVSFTVGGAACPCSIWPAQSPAGGVDADPSSVELGTRFRSNAAGNVTALRFYKHSQNTGTHVGSLWSSTGTLLAQVTFTGETASGWQVQALGTPVALTREHRLRRVVSHELGLLHRR